MKSLVFVCTLCAFAFCSAGLDTFGIVRFFPTRPGTREWNSAHWNNGIARTITYATDPYDPTGWTDDHSSGSDGFRIDGSGTMIMSGSGPRFHINSLITTKVPTQKFRDIEFTAYYQRHGTIGANWGGMVVGLRSGPLGHASPGGNDCDATTYYGRFRNDGKWDFEKELKHPGSTYWSGSGYNTQAPLWHGASLPLNRWIGMKYLAYNIMNDAQVKLELYIDTVSGGNPQNGGTWEKVGEVIDDGAWPSGDVSGCGYANTMIITEGGGTMLLRTDNDTAIYKMVSIREIDAAAARLSSPPRIIRELPGAMRITRNGLITIGEPCRIATHYALFDPTGRLVLRGTIPAGETHFSMAQMSTGINLLRVGSGRETKTMKIFW